MICLFRLWRSDIFEDDFREMNDKLRGGFSYTVDREQIEEYRTWSIDRRMKWLLLANKMRKSLPQKTIELQEAFRQAKI